MPSSVGAVSSDASNAACSNAIASRSPKQKPNYKILEAGDPMTTGIYDASTSLSQSSPTSVTQQ